MKMADESGRKLDTEIFTTVDLNIYLFTWDFHHVQSEAVAIVIIWCGFFLNCSKNKW